MLCDEKYITRHRVLYGVPNVYMLTRKAKTLIYANKRIDKIRLDQIIHDVTVLDVAVCFINSLSLGFGDLKTEKQLHQDDRFGVRTHHPDFIFTKRDKTYCVEVELSLKSKARLEMSYGHTKALLLSTIGNIFFYVIVWIFKLLLNFIHFLSSVFAHFNVVGLALSLILFVTKLYVNAIIFIFITLSEIILALNSRANEIESDTFAFDVGYGRELISGLYLLQKININAKVGIMEQLKASHPHTSDRIAHLERLQSADDEHIF